VNPVFLAILSFALLWLLFLMLRRSRSEPDPFDAAAARSESEVRLPARHLLDQCFSAEDLEFVRARQSPALRRLFLRERRRLAGCWLRETRREARRLLRWHLNSVRYAADLRPAAEAKLLWVAAVFFLVSSALTALVWLYGPLETRRFLASTQELARILTQTTDRMAAAIHPRAVPRMATN